MKYLSLLTIMLCLSSCADFSTTFISSKGKTVTCSASGFGIGESIVAKIQYDKCKERAELAGFTELQ